MHPAPGCGKPTMLGPHISPWLWEDSCAGSVHSAPGCDIPGSFYLVLFPVSQALSDLLPEGSSACYFSLLHTVPMLGGLFLPLSNGHLTG